MPGRDGKVRFAMVKTPTGNLICRAIQTLHPIEVFEDTFECLEALHEPPRAQQEPPPENLPEQELQQASAEPTRAIEPESDEEPFELFYVVIEVHRQTEDALITEEFLFGSW